MSNFDKGEIDGWIRNIGLKVSKAVSAYDLLGYVCDLDWANANNGTWFIGGIIAACGFWGGIKALLIASSISYIFLMMVGYMGTKTGVSTDGHFRGLRWDPGKHHSILSKFNPVCGWTAVNTFIAATSVSYILHSFWGWPTYGQPGGNLGLIVGIVVMSILHLLSIVAGQRSIQIIERIGVIVGYYAC